MSELAAGDVVAARWQLVSSLGEGTSAEVYRARDLGGGPDVALKLLHAGAIQGSDARRRFEREARALAGLQHPHVVGALEVGEHATRSGRSRPYLAMELLTGPSLESLLVRERLAPEVGLSLAMQILAGLGHAHALGIVHRDVKPANVVVHRDERGALVARIVDFGLVRFADASLWGDQSALTQRGAMLGTPAYMSPEHAFGPEIDARSDVYSTGVVIFEMLTGSWPFVAEDVPELLRAHALEPVPTLRDVRPGLEARVELGDFLARALAKRPEDRFPDAQTMRAALAAVPTPAAWLA